MTTFIALPDIHDRSEDLKSLKSELAAADAVLLVGDMTNGNINNLLRLFSIVENYTEALYAVPGNMDTQQMQMLMAREGISLHRRHQMIDGIAVCGVGGALPYVERFVFSEDRFETMLDECIQGVAATTPKILVSHQPPYGTICDKLEHGEHVGSKAVRVFIERVQPLVCFCGHIHEGQGIDHIGQTAVINPGPVGRSRQYAYLEVEDGTVKTLEIRSLPGEV